MAVPAGRPNPSTHKQRGAALFVVVMVITLLTAVGLFAARSTSLVDAATGYARQAAQSVALADYGVQLVASELGQGRAQRVFQLMDLRNQFCPTYGVVTAPQTPQPCYAYDYNQLEARVQQNTGSAFNVIEYQSNLVDGSLGPRFPAASMTHGVDGVLVVEIFDPFEISNIRGESASKPSGREVTINSIAQVRPFSLLTERAQDNATWCSTNAASANAASLLSVRSQVVVPSL
jgi:hypothetical protein